MTAVLAMDRPAHTLRDRAITAYREAEAKRAALEMEVLDREREERKGAFARSLRRILGIDLDESQIDAQDASQQPQIELDGCEFFRGDPDGGQETLRLRTLCAICGLPRSVQIEDLVGLGYWIEHAAESIHPVCAVQKSSMRPLDGPLVSSIGVVSGEEE